MSYFPILWIEINSTNRRSISGNENDEIYEYDTDLVDRAPGYEMQYEDFDDDNFTGGYFLNPMINKVKYRQESC